MIAGNALLMDYFFESEYKNKTYSNIQNEIEIKFKEKKNRKNSKRDIRRLFY